MNPTDLLGVMLFGVALGSLATIAGLAAMLVTLAAWQEEEDGEL